MRGERGIPYARADRWQPPTPFVGQPLGRFGPAAPQRTTGPLVELVPGMAPADQAEDCLTLNVWAPDEGDGLPVMVWIHGGAYVIGASSLPTYEPSRLVARGVVVVSINYRLGALANLLVDGSTNRGLLDQVEALRWVQANIAGFGGDPANVTVFGESAGAGGILHLLGAPAADGLFRRAILQSPGAEVIRRHQAEALAEAFTTPLDAPVQAILEDEQAAADAVAHLFGSMPWAPVVDGVVLPASPQERIAAGGVDVEVLLGHTEAELSMFTGDIPAEYAAKVLQHLWTPVLGHDPGADRCERLVAAYDGDVTQVLSDAAMAIPVVRLSDSLPRVHAYVFDWDRANHHAADLPFTFGTFDVDGWGEFVGADDDARALSDRMIDAWTSFARTGDPGWPAYDATARTTKVFGRADRVGEHPRAGRLPRFEEVA